MAIVELLHIVNWLKSDNLIECDWRYQSDVIKKATNEMIFNWTIIFLVNSFSLETISLFSNSCQKDTLHASTFHPRSLETFLVLWKFHLLVTRCGWFWAFRRRQNKTVVKFRWKLCLNCRAHVHAIMIQWIVILMFCYSLFRCFLP